MNHIITEPAGTSAKPARVLRMKLIYAIVNAARRVVCD
jgi:hypothetical protein